MPSFTGVTYGLGYGSTYIADGTQSFRYDIIPFGSVNGTRVYSNSPQSAYAGPFSQNVYPGDPSGPSCSQQSGGSYSPASTDTFYYNIYTHVVYNGVDIYSSSTISTSVGLDGTTDPFYVQLYWNDATPPTGYTSLDYTIVKNSVTYGTQYVTGVPAGGSYQDADPAQWTTGSPTLSPNSTADVFFTSITWTDPASFDQAIDPSTYGIEVIRYVNGSPSGSQTFMLGTQALNDYGDAAWGSTPATTPTSVYSFYKNVLTWNAVPGAVDYKLFYSPDNFYSNLTPTTTFTGTPTQVDFSGTYSISTGTANGSFLEWLIYPYQVVNGVKVYSTTGGYISNTDNGDGNPYAWQLDWNAITTDPYASGVGYVLHRQYSGGGSDWLDVGNTVSFLDTNSGWSATPIDISNQSFLIEYSINTGNVLTFMDTAAISWTNDFTITPTQAGPFGTVSGGLTGLKVTGLQKFVTLPPTFANNTAAIAGGLTAGEMYRTGADPDVLCIVH